MAFRRKRGDARVGRIERTYGVDFGVRDDMRLDTLLDRTGARSLSHVVALAREGKLEPWRNAERAACARRDLPHVGGSGNPDCDGGERVVEVKEQARPVSGSQLAKIATKRWARDKALEVVSASGFTADARQLAQELGIQLRKR